MEKHLTVEQLAARWGYVAGRKGGIAPGTIRNWRYKNQGPEYMKIGNEILYTEAAVECFEKANKIKTTKGK